MATDTLVLLLSLPLYAAAILSALRLYGYTQSLAQALRRAEAWQRDVHWAQGANPVADLLSRGILRLQRVLGRVVVGSRGVPEAVPTEGDLLQDFLETRPAPDSFRSRFPHIELVLPDEALSTAVNAGPQRCYYAQLDGQGRICGGEFR